MIVETAAILCNIFLFLLFFLQEKHDDVCIWQYKETGAALYGISGSDI